MVHEKRKALLCIGMVEYNYNWNDGTPAGWKFLDYGSETVPREFLEAFGSTSTGASWNVSSEIYVSPPYSLRLVTASNINRHHIAAYRPKLPYIPADYMSIEAYFLMEDVSVFNMIEFAVDRFTGSERRTAAVQWHHRPAGADTWRYWQGGRFGRRDVGEWREISDGEMDLHSMTWYRILLEAKILSNYLRLKVDDVSNSVTLADYDLKHFRPVGITWARSSTWPKQIRCVVSTGCRKRGSQKVYVEDIKFVARARSVTLDFEE